jgi:opacity protein-like surface antigen
MHKNSRTLRIPLSAAAAAALLMPSLAQAGSADWLVGVKPVFEGTSPALGVGRYGVGLSPRSWRAGHEPAPSVFPHADTGPIGFFLAPALTYRVGPNLALEAGLDMTYRSLREPGLVPPQALSPELGGIGLKLGLRYDYDARTQLGLSYRSELRGDPLAPRYYTPRGALLDPAAWGSAPQALSANLQRQLGERWSLLGSFGWQQSETVALRGDAWTAGLGAQYRLHPDLDLGMALEYSTGMGFDATRRSLARDLPAADGGSYFFGLDLNWRF